MNLDVNSKRAWLFAESMLESCQIMHPKCAQKEPTYLPNRVVDVSCSPPRLYLSRGESDKYACLSYSWGGDQPLKLTTDNLPFYLKELPLAQLPQTLQDAILVTQKLGIRYLWIDSLCIYSDRSRMKHCRNLRFEPPFCEGVDLPP